MTTTQIICILCSAGGYASAIAVLFFVLAGKAIHDAGPRARVSTGVRVLLAVSLLIASTGAVGCSVRGQVCEVAGAVQP